ncbi:MFS transporter [Bartonella rattaustraliani]|uniref:MFS transporter n=1 Tax=Bartonella rattaustraliani TaxID=481139 RepID=UPI003CC792DD
MPATLMFAISSAWVGRQSQKIKPKYFILVGLMLFIAASLGLSFIASAPTPLFLLCLALLGIGWGTILSPSTLITLHSLPQNQAALAMGTSWTVHNIGGACGVALTVAILSHSEVLSKTYNLLIMVLLILAFFSFFITTILTKKY